MYRPPALRKRKLARIPTVLVATSGGGTAQTAQDTYAQIDAIATRTRQVTDRPFHLVQAIGPRARALGQLATADSVINHRARLHDHFHDADIVLSAGSKTRAALLRLARSTPLPPSPLPSSTP